MRARGRDVAAALVVASVAFLPFLRGAFAGHSFYFRDLSLYFFPLRQFVLDGLRSGRVFFWNPFVHEGLPLSLPPVSYPLDLLQVLWPSEAGLSFLLALHIPLAGAAQFALARGLGVRREGAAGAGLVYALGGFGLSTLNLYVYVQALAWAPLVILGLVRAAEGRRRDVAWAALATAVALSTTAIEVVAQAFLVGLVLSRVPSRPAAWARTLGAGLLAAGLASIPLVLVLGQVSASARGSGFSTDVVLAHSIHPMTFAQTLVAGLYGDPSRGADAFWGQNFFPRGFPYFVSLYLGAVTLALAVVGVARRSRLAALLAGIAILAGVVCLGRWAGLAPLVELLPPLQRLRYPSKAFFSLHVAASLLAGLGLEALAGSPLDRRSWRWLAGGAAVLGGVLVALRTAPLLLVDSTRWFTAHFFPPESGWETRTTWLHAILTDASRGGVLALAAAILGIAVLTGRFAPRAAAVLLGVLATADLLRAGAGLNPMVTRAFHELSPGTAARLPELRASGRVFACDVGGSPSYLAARAPREDHETWTFALLRETLTPNLNLKARVRSALSVDLTMLAPEARVLDPLLAACQDPESLVARWREAGVGHVLSVDPLPHPQLALEAVVRSPEIAPLEVRHYRFRETNALAEIVGRVPGQPPPAGEVIRMRDDPGALEFQSRAAQPARLVVREGYDPGWSAVVNGERVDVRRSEGGHIEVDVPAAPARVALLYRPRLLGLGGVMTAASWLVVGLLMFGGGRAIVPPRTRGPGAG